MRRFILSALMTLLFALCLPADSFASNDLATQEEAAVFSALDIVVAATATVSAVAATNLTDLIFGTIANSATNDTYGADGLGHVLDPAVVHFAEPQMSFFAGGYDVLKMPAQMFETI